MTNEDKNKKGARYVLGKAAPKKTEPEVDPHDVTETDDQSDLDVAASLWGSASSVPEGSIMFHVTDGEVFVAGGGGTGGNGSGGGRSSLGAVAPGVQAATPTPKMQTRRCTNLHCAVETYKAMPFAPFSHCPNCRHLGTLA